MRHPVPTPFGPRVSEVAVLEGLAAPEHPRPAAAQDPDPGHRGHAGSRAKRLAPGFSGVRARGSLSMRVGARQPGEAEGIEVIRLPAAVLVSRPGHL